MSKTPEKIETAPQPYEVASPSAAPVINSPAVAYYPEQQIPLPYPAPYQTQPGQIVNSPTSQTSLIIQQTPLVIQQNPQQPPRAQQQGRRSRIDIDSNCCCRAVACCLCLKVCDDLGCCCCCKIIFKILSVITVFVIIALIIRFTVFS